MLTSESRITNSFTPLTRISNHTSTEMVSVTRTLAESKPGARVWCLVSPHHSLPVAAAREVIQADHLNQHITSSNQTTR